MKEIPRENYIGKLHIEREGGCKGDVDVLGITPCQLTWPVHEGKKQFSIPRDQVGQDTSNVS